MALKFAILVDGGFVIAKLRKRLGKSPEASHVGAECKRIQSHPALKGHRLLRAYFYHAPPATDELQHPLDQTITKLSESPVYHDTRRLLDSLELQPDFALRLGETLPVGWKLGDRAVQSLSEKPRTVQAADLVPDIKQKGVDLRIGLDIARLSLCHLVDTIVVVTGDSDMVPAFKFARREGLRIYLDHLGHGVRRELKAHADLIL